MLIVWCHIGYILIKQKTINIETGGKVMKTMNQFLRNRNSPTKRVMVGGMVLMMQAILLSLTVHSQVTWKQYLTIDWLNQNKMSEEYEADNKTQMNFEESVTTSTSTFYFEQESDKPLELESWMTDDAYFGAYNNLFELEVEPELELENWMIDESHFSSQHLLDKDKELKLEEWMIDDKHWSLK